MTEEGICERLEITMEERRAQFSRVAFLNDERDNPEALRSLGRMPAEEIAAPSDGLFEMDVEVAINARLFNHDRIIIGPVLPHEVIGFSGGNNYLFPGIGGPEVVTFFQWLGAMVTYSMIIGNKRTPVGKVVERTAALLADEMLYELQRPTPWAKRS